MPFIAISHRLRAFAAILIAVAGVLLAACSETSSNYQFWRVSTAYSFENKLAEPFGIAFHKGRVYVTDGQNGEIRSFVPGDGEVSTINGFDTPSGIAVGSGGEVIVADPGTNTIKQFTLGKEPSDIAGRANVRGFADGLALEALFNGPTGVAVFPDGRIAVADTYNDRIRIIENGFVRTLAGAERGFADGNGANARFDTPLGIAVWRGEKLLVADSGNRRIRVVEPDGSVWTLAGDGGYELRDGMPASASLVGPTAVAADEEGRIFIADGNAIRAIGLRSFPYLETIAGGERGLTDSTPRLARFNRPSGLALLGRTLFIADSDNAAVRIVHAARAEAGLTISNSAQPLTAAAFRSLQPGRWPYDPPERTREIAGTLGEIRGEIIDQTSEAWFHNGLDIPGAYGETARFIRDEKVLDPHAAENFGTLRELLRMPTIGYVHIRLGRGSDDRLYDDPRFLFEFEPASGKPISVRVPRGAKFKAGEPVGTLNAMNHVHLIAGRPGAEMNALDALVLPGVSDSIAPVIEEIRLFDEIWMEIPAGTALTGKTRVVVKAYDRKDGNAERRRLAPYRLGYELIPAADAATANDQKPTSWTISFEKMPSHRAVKFAYAPGSRSGATGETIFNFAVTNRVDGDTFSEGFIDPATRPPGNYILRVFAADFFGNTSRKDLPVTLGR